MSQVDITRFVANIQQLFAPSIHEGQVFIAYLDEDDNSYTVKGDNLSFEGSGALSGSVEKLQQNLDALQAVVNALQPIINELSESNAINIVDDIIYGYDDSSLNPENLIDLKGRPFLTFDGYSFGLTVDNHLASDWDSKVRLSQQITAGSVFAGFGDGKIHTVNDVYDENSITSTALSNGDFIFNKADGNLYVFDAVNHSFVRLGGKQYYAVDYIVDYVGYDLPATFDKNETWFFQLDHDFIGGRLLPFCRHTSYEAFSFANIQGILSDKAKIYSVEHYTTSEQAIIAVHDLYDGDIIYNRTNGYSYTFFNSNGIKSFIKNSESIAVVEDIVFGYHDRYADSPLTPQNLKALRVRPYLDSLYFELCLDNSFSSGSLNNPNDAISSSGANSIYAGFGDGQLHSIVQGDYEGDLRYGGCQEIKNGAFILCKADNEIYTYDADNRKFIRLGHGRNYVVDMIVDYVGDTLPATFTDEGTIFFEIYEGNGSLYKEFQYMAIDSSSQQLTKKTYFEPEAGFTFANIQSSLTDDAGIYLTTDYAVRVIHDLYDGDTIYCKANGCSYIFFDNGTTKSFIRTSAHVIAPVLDIVHIGHNMPEYPSAKGDKYLDFDSDYDSNVWLYTAPNNSSWGEARAIQTGERYASLDNHRIYEFQEYNSRLFPVIVPIGVPFLSKADNEIYVFDGSEFIKASGIQQENSYAPVIAPVLDIVHIGNNRPDSPSSIEDKYIYYLPSENGGYAWLNTARDSSSWEDSTLVPAGERYASTSDFKIYTFTNDYSVEATISNIPVGVPFLNKSNNCLYVFDGSTFIKTGGS